MKENLAAGFQSKLLSADGPRFQLAWVGLSPTQEEPAAKEESGGGRENKSREILWI